MTEADQYEKSFPGPDGRPRICRLKHGVRASDNYRSPLRERFFEMLAEDYLACLAVFNIMSVAGDRGTDMEHTMQELKSLFDTFKEEFNFLHEYHRVIGDFTSEEAIKKMRLVGDQGE